MRFLRYSIIPVFAFLCPALPSSAQLPSGAVHEAIADLNEQKFPEAETILTDVLREHPQDPMALGLMVLIITTPRSELSSRAVHWHIKSPME